jgi:DNA-binding NarL/FixJ family response regulator
MCSENYCLDCPSRSICQSPCPELELHLKEIECNAQELPIGLPRHGKVPWSSSIYLTKTEKEILTLLGKGLSRKEVCETINMTRETLRVHLVNLKKKHKES